MQVTHNRRIAALTLPLVFLFTLTVAAPAAHAKAMAKAKKTSSSNATPTNFTVYNSTGSAVYANLVLGQPAATPPNNCSSLGQQIVSVTDSRLAFTSSTGNAVAFTPQASGITDKGYYQLAAGETITYVPQTFACPAGTCSPAITFNFFFTAGAYNGAPNNGCAGSTTFPNATNLAEASINFGINGSTGEGCANADAADLSCINGINASLKLSLSGNSWPFNQASNGNFGKNANRPAVFGWAANTCVADAGYPNPSANCPPPANAPLAGNGSCKTPGGVSYPPITDPATNVQYCAELSDPTAKLPQGPCVDQRQANVTGGTLAITFAGFL